MKRLVPSPDVVVQEQDGEAFLLHTGTGSYFGLNPSGLIAWNAVTAGEDPEAALRAAYPSTPADVIKADWDGLQADLVEADLLKTDTSG